MSIYLDRVSKTYMAGDVVVHALKEVTLQIETGEIVVILGPSGSGKSTLLNVIGGIDRCDSGEIRVDGRLLTGLSEQELTEYRRQVVSFIFQTYNLIPTLTAEENVEVGFEISKNPLEMKTILEQVAMYDKRRKFPHQLSGGEQQRIAIARALVKNPSVLLCDEPTGALDEHNGKKILRLLQDINQSFHTTILLITHNPGISRMAHKVIKISSGEIVELMKNDHPIPAERVQWV